MREWIVMPDRERLDLARIAAGKTSLPLHLIEKDWWVTITLEAIFTSSLKEKFAFKGGTSLSKSWKILYRFSEDVDIVIDKTIFGIGQNESIGKGKRDRLRKEAHRYILEKVVPAIKQRLTELKVPAKEYTIEDEPTSSDQDPTVLYLNYRPITTVEDAYTPQRVKIEIGVRALMEPSEDRKIQSLLAETLELNESVTVSTILPERTFWEKAFLLHELFKHPLDKMDIDRKSRHWYDLHRLYEEGYAQRAMADKELFEAIRAHRKIFTKDAHVNYDELTAAKLDLFPPPEHDAAWQADYQKMIESYIYHEPPSMDSLRAMMKKIMAKFAELGF